MLTKTELNFLKNMKRFKKLSSEQIEEELINLIGSQNGLKDIKKKLHLSEKNLEKSKNKILELEEKIKKKNKEIFSLTLKVNANRKEVDTTGSLSVRTSNVFQLKRILCFLEEQKGPVNKNTIFKECGMVSSQGNSGLNFLTNHNLIKKDYQGYSKCH